MRGQYWTSKESGETGELTSVVNNCLFLRLADGTPYSGGRARFREARKIEIGRYLAFRQGVAQAEKSLDIAVTNELL